MPACFALTRIGEKVPTTINAIDTELCQAHDLEWNATRYVYGWFDDIGFSIAIGKTWDNIADKYQTDIRDEPDSPYLTHELMMLRFVHYLRQHYTADGWQEIGRW